MLSNELHWQPRPQHWMHRYQGSTQFLHELNLVTYCVGQGTEQQMIIDEPQVERCNGILGFCHDIYLRYERTLVFDNPNYEKKISTHINS